MSHPRGSIEYHGFSGSPRSVAGRLFALPRDLVQRPCYALLLEGDRQAHVRIFERSSGASQGPVALWQGEGLGELPAHLMSLCLQPPDSDVGGTASIASALRDHGEFTQLGMVPCPPSPRGAFGHPLRDYVSEGRIRSYVLGLSE